MSITRNFYPKYTDWITGESLLSSCKVLYDNETNKKTFKGVVCMDINNILNLTDLESKSDYTTFFNSYVIDNKKCPTEPFDYKKQNKDINIWRLRTNGMSCQGINIHLF